MSRPGDNPPCSAGSSVHSVGHSNYRQLAASTSMFSIADRHIIITPLQRCFDASSWFTDGCSCSDCAPLSRRKVVSNAICSIPKTVGHSDCSSASRRRVATYYLVYLLSVGRMIATYSDKSLLLAVSFEIITSCLDEVFVLIKIQHKASDFGWPTITVGPGTNYWNGTYQLLLMVQINCLGSNDPFGVESKCQPVWINLWRAYTVWIQWWICWLR